MLASSLLFAALALPAADLEHGAALFASHCQQCHGVGGKLDPESPVVKALPATPKDFSDPLFNSREPRADWAIVIRHGGPALGFSSAMPAFGSILSDEDIEDLLAYLKSIPKPHRYPDGDLNFFVGTRTKKAFPEDEWVIKHRRTRRAGIVRDETVLEFERRFGERSQFYAEGLWAEGARGRRAETLELGVKHVFAQNLEAEFLAAAGIGLRAPLVSSRQFELRPFLAVGKALPSASWQGSLRLIVPESGLDRGGIELGSVFHWLWSDWPRQPIPALELFAEKKPLSGGRWRYSAIPQLRFGLNRRGHVMATVGYEYPLNARALRDERRWHFMLAWDFADGGLLEGW